MHETGGDRWLAELQRLIQRDACGRGLARQPQDNLWTHRRSDFAAACRHLAMSPVRRAAILTGFYIPRFFAGETDGPLGAYFLGRALQASGWSVAFAAEPHTLPALERAASLDAAGDFLFASPAGDGRRPPLHQLLADWQPHVIAVEVPGPSHMPASVRQQAGGRADADLTEAAFRRAVPPDHWDQGHSMSGAIIPPPQLRLAGAFERWQRPRPSDACTIGIGDGGNEVGMGCIPWATIAGNVPHGERIACRLAADYLIVAGVSNWGAYALAAGVCGLLGGRRHELFAPAREERLWRRVLEDFPLVDGVTGARGLSVDGLDWGDYVRPLHDMADLLRAWTS